MRVICFNCQEPNEIPTGKRIILHLHFEEEGSSVDARRVPIADIKRIKQFLSAADKKECLYTKIIMWNGASGIYIEDLATILEKIQAKGKYEYTPLDEDTVTFKKRRG